MPSKTKKKAKPESVESSESTHERYDYLGGLLLAGLGLVALPINFGLIPQLSWARAWPLFLVLVGAVLVVKHNLSRE